MYGALDLPRGDYDVLSPQQKQRADKLVRPPPAKGAKIMKLYQDMMAQYMQMVDVEQMKDEMGAYEYVPLFSTRY
jgi:hypothetical protein